LSPEFAKTEAHISIWLRKRDDVWIANAFVEAWREPTPGETLALDDRSSDAEVQKPGASEHADIVMPRFMVA